MMKETQDIESGYGINGSYIREVEPKRTSICSFITEVPQSFVSVILNCFTHSSSQIIMQSGRKVTIGKLIGEGGFSYVYEAIDNQTGEKFALKKVICQTMEQICAIKNEISVHKRFVHKSLLKLVDHTAVNTGSGNTYYLLFPLYTRGTLRDYINDHLRRVESIPEKEVLSLFYQVCQGVRVLHTFNPSHAHRDIKPENILLGTKQEGPVLMDFGSVAFGDVKITNRSEALELQETASQHSSMPYRAPELYDVPSQCQISCSTDVWSLGCLLFAMAFGYSPFECIFTRDGRIEIVECSHLRVIGKWKFPSQSVYSNAFCDLIRWMLSIDPRHRPSIIEIIEKVQRMISTN